MANAGFEEAVRRIADVRANSASTLNLEGLELTSLPAALGELVNLTTLILQANELANLPDWISELVNLTRLSADNNQLTALPDSIGKLTKLSELTLRGNRIAKLPESLGNLADLTKLDINNNQLAALPETLAHLTSLTELYLGDNELTELPEYVGNFRSLARLDADNNQLGQIPDSIGNLTNLSEVDLGANLLTVLPDSVGNLTSLTTLYLGYNLLDTLPASIGNLSSLTRLTLRNNKLTTLPESLGKLTRLARLSLEGNTLSNIEPEIIAAGTAAIISYLHASQDETVPQWTSKLVVVGDSSAGKTSLIKALHGQSHNPAEPSTHGLTITELLLDHPVEADIIMSLSMWDFGGQDIYHATHQFFLTDRSMFLLVWNARTGADRARLRYWLETIKARAPRAPIMLVATHTADQPADIDLGSLIENYPEIDGHFSVDCATRDGIGSLTSAIGERAAALPLMGQPWPRTWVHAANALASHSMPPHIPAAQMRRIMSSAGVIHPDDQDALAQVLNYRGQILRYPDDPDLSDTIVLDPQWLNTQISRLLDGRALTERGGLLTQEDIHQAWQGLELPLRRQLLILMQKYDVCYLVTEPRVEAIAVVVSRLSQSPPDYEPDWNQPLQHPGCREIRIIYSLPVLPPGIPGWFLARSHRFATDLRWRHGAVLIHPDREHKALLRTDVERQTVELAVRGPLPAAFFAVLDDGLNLTFDRYPGMEIQRFIPCPGHDQHSCPKLFNYAKLVDRLKRGYQDIYCDEAEEPVNIAQLLLGIGPTNRELADLALHRRLTEITASVQQLTEYAEVGQRSFMKLQNLIQKSQETRCPSVFIITPSSRNTIGRKTYLLRLYCEEPEAWHPLPDETGCYIITEVTPWLRTAGPHIQRTLRILAAAAPLAGSILDIAAAEFNKRIQHEIELAAHVISAIPTHVGHENSQVIRAGQYTQPAPRQHAQTDADFRSIEAMLLQLDPNRTWGGLSRTVTPEGLTLYLCAYHHACY